MKERSGFISNSSSTSFIIPLPVKDLKKITLDQFTDLFKPRWNNLNDVVSRTPAAKLVTEKEYKQLIYNHISSKQIGETLDLSKVEIIDKNYATNPNTPTYLSAYKGLHPFTKYEHSEGTKVQCAEWEDIGSQILHGLEFLTYWNYDMPDFQLARFLIGLRDFELPPPEYPNYGALAVFKYFYHNLFSIHSTHPMYDSPTISAIRFANTILINKDKYPNIYLYEWEFEDKGGIEEFLHEHFPDLLPAHIPYLSISHH